MKTKVILALVLAVIIVIILIQNTQVVTFRFFFWKISMSQIILVPFAMFIGFLIGFLLAKATGRKNKNKYPEI